MVQFSTKKFKELDTKELHDVFALRSEVFVVEQMCVYQDIDGKDTDAFHVLGHLENEIIAYARIVNRGVSYPDYIAIGRIVVAKQKRGQQIGHDLVTFCLEQVKKIFHEQKIKISAQAHLEQFYNKHGFEKMGAVYLEDGIPHIAMTVK